MNCTEVREHLSMYIDDELDIEQISEVEEHLAGCVGCMQEYDELSEITMLLRAVPSVSLPPSFDERLRRSIQEEKEKLTQSVQEEKVKKASDYRKRLKMFSGIAAVFVIGIFSITMYNHMDNIANLSNNSAGETLMPGGGMAPMASMYSEDDIDSGSGFALQAEIDADIDALNTEMDAFGAEANSEAINAIMANARTDPASK